MGKKGRTEAEEGGGGREGGPPQEGQALENRRKCVQRSIMSNLETEGGSGRDSSRGSRGWTINERKRTAPFTHAEGNSHLLQRSWQNEL